MIDGRPDQRRRLPPARDGACKMCGGAASRTWGADPICDGCRADRVADLRAGILARDGIGVGLRAGVRRADYGPNVYDLACGVCSATWAGEHGDPCPWCLRRLEQLHADQRRLLLRPDLPERGDDRRAGALEAWAGRLARAVATGLVTDTQARRALAREDP